MKRVRPCCLPHGVVFASTKGLGSGGVGRLLWHSGGRVSVKKQEEVAAAGEKQQKMERKKHILNIDFSNEVYSVVSLVLVVLGYRRRPLILVVVYGDSGGGGAMVEFDG